MATFPPDASPWEYQTIKRLVKNRPRLVQLLRECFGDALTLALPTEIRQDLTSEQILAVPCPSTDEIDAWLALHLQIELEVAVTQADGRLVGFIPMQVGWPERMDGFDDLVFPFTWAYIELDEFFTDSAVLTTLRRIHLFDHLQRLLPEAVRNRRRRYLVLSKEISASDRDLLNGQGIIVHSEILR